jgi:uncharacterized protein YgbK (DUF1537 family)
LALQLAILADDLTGALDSAAPFAARGCRVEVALCAEATAEACLHGADIVAVSTRSRELTVDEARAAVSLAAAALPPGVRIFKKIDSRLKGHVEVELSALTFSGALVAPAIVDFGRVVKDGAVTGFGVENAIPIAAVLGRFAGRSTIPDVGSDEEMRAALDRADEADLLVGARGLAEALARRLTGVEQPTVAALAGPRSILVVGSRDPITLAQVEALRSQEDVTHLPAPNGIFDARRVLEAGTNLVLVQAMPGDRAVQPHDVAVNLAEHLRPIVPDCCDTLFLTGGATAEAVLGAMGIDRMRLLGECLPGLPVGVAGDLTIVAKSGGFGEVGALVRVAEMIRRAKR